MLKTDSTQKQIQFGRGLHLDYRLYEEEESEQFIFYFLAFKVSITLLITS